MARKMTKAERADDDALRANQADTLRLLIAQAFGGAEGATTAPSRDDAYRGMNVVVTKVSRDGMHRRMRCFLPAYNRRGGWDAIDITWHVARVLRWTYTDDGIGVGGCGMDMVFHLVYSLGQALYDDGYALGLR